MKTHISADLGRFLIAGIANTALTSAVYFLDLLILTPAISYAVAWVVGVIFVMWFYPDRVFVGSNAGISQRVALGLTIAAVFFAGEAVLHLVLSMTGRPDLAFVVALATTFILNFVFGRLLMRTEIVSALSMERVATTIFVALPIACLCWMALQWLNHGIDLPYFDDWRDYASGNIASLSPAYLFRPANDTLYVVGKTLDALAFRVLRGNSVAYQFLSMTIVLGSLLALQWNLLKAGVPNRLLCAAAFSLTVLMIQPDSYWGLQNLAYHQALPLVFILTSIYVVTVAKWQWVARAGALFILGLLSGLTYISGAFAILAVALTLIACIAINRRAFLTLVPDAAALLLAGLVTTSAQAWVILFQQKGHIHTRTAWALPTDIDFWLYLFGKIGRSLMLPSRMPLISLIVVGAMFAIALSVAAVSLYRVSIAKGLNEGQTRASLTTLLLFASVFCYLLMVAAGRADLRGPAISTPLQIFSFGFIRFHFFWATLLWPWVFAGAVQRWSEQSLIQRSMLAAAAGAIVIFATAQGAFSHNSYFRHASVQANANAECLRRALMAGGQIYCPRLYPTDMTQAYANAVSMGASFVRYFPPTLLGAKETTPSIDVLAQDYSIHNASYTNGARELALDAGSDVQLLFSLKDPDYLKGCLGLRLGAEVETGQPTLVQLFYQPGAWERFAPVNSRTIRLSTQTGNLEFLVLSPKGFRNSFRFDPVLGSQSVIIHNLTMRCVLRKNGR
jgi:hypothetical protein